MRLTLLLLAALLAGCRPPDPPPDLPPMSSQLSVVIETEAAKKVLEHATFAAGSKFRVRYRTTTELYLYAFRKQADGSFLTLAPEQKLDAEKDYTLPAGEEWYQFGAGKGHDEFVLAAAPLRVPALAALRGAVAQAKLEELCTNLEREWPPLGIRRFEEDGWMRTVFFGGLNRISLVLRLPLFHQ